jgi:hypothetical protein
LSAELPPSPFLSSHGEKSHDLITVFLNTIGYDNFSLKKKLALVINCDYSKLFFLAEGFLIPALILEFFSNSYSSFHKK